MNIGADGDVDGAARVKRTKPAQHRHDIQGSAVQSPVPAGDERVQPHVVIDNPHHCARPALGERVQVRLQCGSGVGDGQLAALVRAAVQNDPAGSVFEMLPAVDEMDAQPARAFVRDKCPKVVIGRSPQAILEHQDIQTRQSGVSGKVLKIGEQTAHLFQPIGICNHPRDQVGPILGRIAVSTRRCGRGTLCRKRDDRLGRRFLPPEQPPGTGAEPCTLGFGHAAAVLAEEAVESGKARG